MVASFDRLTATKPLAWRLGYVAAVEATFTSYFKVFLDHEDTLFAPGDDRVASLFLWHFLEEIEHRSSALRVYDSVHDSYPYRGKTVAGLARHIDEILRLITRGFREHVPEADGGHFGRLIREVLSPKAFYTSLRAARALTGPGQATYAAVPKRELAAMLLHAGTRLAPRSRDTDAPALCPRYDRAMSAARTSR